MSFTALCTIWKCVMLFVATICWRLPRKVDVALQTGTTSWIAGNWSGDNFASAKVCAPKPLVANAVDNDHMCVCVHVLTDSWMVLGKPSCAICKLELDWAQHRIK